VSHYVRPIALALTVLTGFSGLVYEVTWQKYLATLVGSHAEAAAAVLGIFLAGLSIGYGFFGSLSARRVVRFEGTGGSPRLLAIYGCVELGIGLYAFAFPTVFAATEILSIGLPVADPGLRFAVDVVLTALVIGPSAVLMGATVPFLTQALPTGLSDASRLHAQIYALNTVGGCGGALAAAFWLVPNFGLDRGMLVVGSINVACGLAFIALDRMATESPKRSVAKGAGATGTRHGSAEDARPLDSRRRELNAMTAAALLSGFAMMTLQTVVIRLGGLSFGASPFAFASVVAVFVLCIAIGSLAVGLMRTIDARALVISQSILVAMLLLLYWPVAQAPYWAYRLRALFPSEPEAFLQYWLSTIGAIAFVLGPAIALSGAMLPLLFDRLRDDPEQLGAVSGRLYRWNTVGSLLGAMLGGYAFLHWLDLDGVYRLAVVAIIATTVLLAWVTGQGRPRRVLGVALIATILVVGLPRWDQDLLAIGLFRVRTLLDESSDPLALARRTRDGEVTVYYDDDPVQSVAVRSWDVEGERSLSLVNNGKSEGSTRSDRITMRLAALLPAVLAEKVERAHVIGLGTGMTAGQLAALDSIESVVVSEISPAVIEALPLFDFATGDASTNPKIEIVESDAYRQLSREGRRYDLLISEPSNPWVAGVEMLYTEEFLSTARDRLRPGGIYVQWFHQYETNDETVEIILRTFDRVFAETAIWSTQSNDLLVLGFAAPVPDVLVLLDRIEGRVADPVVAESLASLGIDDLPSLLAHEVVPLGVVRAGIKPGAIHRLGHPILSDVAGRGFFLGGRGELPYLGAGRARALGPERSLLEEHVRRSGGWTSASRLAVLDEHCRHDRWACATGVAAWAASGRDVGVLERWLTTASADTHAVLSRDLAADLAPLFGRNSPARDPVSLQDAMRALALARVGYQPTRPFDSAALTALWDACPECVPYRENLVRFQDHGELTFRVRQAGDSSAR